MVNRPPMAALIASFLCSPALAGQSIAVKQPPTAFDLCVVQANAQLTTLTEENKKLTARVVALQQQLALREKPVSTRKLKRLAGKSLPCKVGRTRNAQGQCGRWGRKLGFNL